MDVYLDRYQCEEFEIDYEPAGSRLTVRADKLLASKAGGYDAAHTMHLERFGQQWLTLEGIGYGWFRMVGCDPPWQVEA